jgi:hypothetical protein
MRHVVRKRENKKCIQILVQKPEGMILLESSRFGWKDNIKMNFTNEEVKM